MSPIFEEEPAALVTFLLFNCSSKPETLVTEGYNQQEMDKAIARAQREIDDFVQVLIKADAESFSVKAPISEGDETEHFWLTDVSYENGSFTGQIGNEPGLIRSVQFGQQWELKKEEISDWMYTKGNKIYGGYTIDPLLSTMPKAEAETMRARLVR